MTPEEIRRLPKAEVHVHLEGCFEREDVSDLAAAGGERLPRPPHQLFSFDDLQDFLAFLDWSCGLVRTREQLARAAYRFAEREAASGVLYADVIVNPSHWRHWRDRLDELVDALDAGFTEAEQEGLTHVGLCISLLRNQSASEAIELVDWVLTTRHPRVVALSIDGDESAAGRTGPRFAEAFRRAADAGLHRTAHAGESSGPEGVWDAIDLLAVERVDHGVTAIEDARLVAELARREIPLGVCPWSNVVLGLYRDRAAHPLERLRRAGVRVSINTDDPALLGCRLEDEYVAAAATYGWVPDVVRSIAHNSIEASFCDDELQTRMLAALDRQRQTEPR